MKVKSCLYLELIGYPLVGAPNGSNLHSLSRQATWSVWSAFRQIWASVSLAGFGSWVHSWKSPNLLTIGVGMGFSTTYNHLRLFIAFFLEAWWNHRCASFFPSHGAHTESQNEHSFGSLGKDAGSQGQVFHLHTWYLATLGCSPVPLFSQPTQPCL